MKLEQMLTNDQFDNIVANLLQSPMTHKKK